MMIVTEIRITYHNLLSGGKSCSPDTRILNLKPKGCRGLASLAGSPNLKFEGWRIELHAEAKGERS